MPDDRLIQPLRAAIAANPTSRYALAKKAGLSESILSRFVNGKQGIGLETAERLAEILELSLVQRTTGDKALVSTGPAREPSPAGKRSRRRPAAPLDEFADELREKLHVAASVLADKYLSAIISRDHIEFEPTHDAVIAEIHVGVGDLVSAVRKTLRRRVKPAAELAAVSCGPTVSRAEVHVGCRALNLGAPRVGEPVDERTLRRNYREFARKYHPDRHANDEEMAERFREATTAYNLLRKYNDELAERTAAPVTIASRHVGRRSKRRKY